MRERVVEVAIVLMAASARSTTGSLSVTPAPGVTHQRVKRRLFDVLLDHVERRGSGELIEVHALVPDALWPEA